MKLALVGFSGGSHLGGSFARAAANAGIDAFLCDAGDAFRAPRIARALSWRLAGRRPPRLAKFSRETMERCARESPEVLIALGAVLSPEAVRILRSRHVTCLIFCSDDPWNQAVSGEWHLAALPEYDMVFTPRRSNIDDFRKLGCRNVHYLPFGFDDRFFNSMQERKSRTRLGCAFCRRRRPGSRGFHGGISALWRAYGAGRQLLAKFPGDACQRDWTSGPLRNWSQ